jgi:predicted alpha/beta hydrolase family esterase
MNKMCRARHRGLPGTKPPFLSLIAASRHGALARFGRRIQLAGDRGARLVGLGHVGHFDLASEYSPWPTTKE